MGKEIRVKLYRETDWGRFYSPSEPELSALNEALAEELAEALAEEFPEAEVGAVYTHPKANPPHTGELLYVWEEGSWVPLRYVEDHLRKRLQKAYTRAFSRTLERVGEILGEGGEA